MSRPSNTLLDPLNSFPRVSGDEPLLDDRQRRLLEFSPRERG